MMILRFIILTIFILSLAYCEEVPTNLAPAAMKRNSQKDTILLLYKKEQKGEIWLSGEPAQLLDSFAWKEDYPLGELSNSKNTVGFWDSPLQSFQGKRALVLPHKFNAEGQLGPCFACRHDQIEAYASMHLILRELGVVSQTN